MQPRLRYLPISVFSIILGLAGYTIATQRVFAGQGWSEGLPTAFLFACHRRLRLPAGAVCGQDCPPSRCRGGRVPSPRHDQLLPDALDLAAAAQHRLPGRRTRPRRSTSGRSARPSTSCSRSWCSRSGSATRTSRSRTSARPGSSRWWAISSCRWWAWSTRRRTSPGCSSPSVSCSPSCLLVIFMYRMVFHQPLTTGTCRRCSSSSRRPPWAAVAYVKLTGSYDSFARILYFLAVFFAVFLIVHVQDVRAHPLLPLVVGLYTFPHGGAHHRDLPHRQGDGLCASTQDAAPCCGSALSVLVAGLLVRTLVAVGRREICIFFFFLCLPTRPPRARRRPPTRPRPWRSRRTRGGGGAVDGGDGCGSAPARAGHRRDDEAAGRVRGGSDAAEEAP